MSFSTIGLSVIFVIVMLLAFCAIPDGNVFNEHGLAKTILRVLGGHSSAAEASATVFVVMFCAAMSYLAALGALEIFDLKTGLLFAGINIVAFVVGNIIVLGGFRILWLQ